MRAIAQEILMISLTDTSLKVINLLYLPGVNELIWNAILGSDNGLAPDRHLAIIWTNAG